MANFYPSANMGLPVPTTGVDPGPDYANNVNASLTLVDAHDHSTGKGVQITPTGLNINSDLTMQLNNLTNARTLRMSPQTAVLSQPTDLECLYVVSKDLYYNDGNGTAVRITQSGAVAGTPGSIANLVSPASASYVSGSSSFVWQSNANTPANTDQASAILRNLTANSKGLTLSPPASLGADYTIVFPALPGSGSSFVTIDSSGNMGSSIPTSGGINTSNIANSAITTAKIADANVTTAKILDANVTRPKLVAVGQQISASSGSFSTNSTIYAPVANLTNNITTTGRPVMLIIQPDGVSPALYISPSGQASNIRITRDGTEIANWSDGGTTVGRPLSLAFLDVPSAAGHTYLVQVKVTGGTLFMENFILVTYEL